MDFPIAWKKFRGRRAFCILAGLFVSQFPTPAADIGHFDFSTMTRMVIFGDSLSDYGNTGTVNSAYRSWSEEAQIELPGIPGWPAPYNSIQRFTNAKMWSVFLSQKANAVNSNFAVVSDMDSLRALPYDPFFGEAANPDVWYHEITDSVGVPDSAYKNSPAGHQNWAWGGAQTALQVDDNLAVTPNFPDSPLITANAILPIQHGYSLASVKDQIAMHGNSGNTFDDSTMTFLWAGANDYILYGAATSPDSYVGNLIDAPDRPMDLGQNAAQKQLENLQALIDQGATNLVVMNLPDIGKTPAAFAGEFSDFSLTPSQYVEDFNAALFQGILDLEVPEGVMIGFVDIYTKFNDMIANPTDYGLDPSLMQQSIVENEGNVSDPSLNPLFIGSGYDDAGWLFWDHVHPTENGHEILGNYVFESIIVPEPSSLALLTMLGGLLLAFRQRAKGGR